MKSKLAIAPYIELTKPRILTLVLVTTTLGYYLAGEGQASLRELLFFLIGVAFVTGGGSALNHYFERDVDGKMDRTKNRPLPSGILEPDAALSFGIFLIFTGLFILFLYSNLLSTFLTLLAAFLYVVVYTPMKRLSWLNTTIGAIPGALPPMIGWTAVTNQVDLGAWILFLILFIWQHPHFYAIAWMFREDYAKAGFKMLPVVDPSGKRMFRQIFFFSLFLIPISVLPTMIGLSGKIYFAGALFLSVSFFVVGVMLIRSKSIQNARKLLKASVIYLPLLLILIIFDNLIPL